MSAGVSGDLVGKVEILNPEALQKDPTNLTVILHEEDHTIGNSLKHILCKMAEVEFCGYNVPHPLEDKIFSSCTDTARCIGGKRSCRSNSTNLSLFLHLYDRNLKMLSKSFTRNERADLT
uniref:DNA-directed RNA polymerases I and III subunit RPAC2 n=1 Tax=Ascaris suum TaxID=6253 RepID=F1L850_ASCSU